MEQVTEKNTALLFRSRAMRNGALVVCVLSLIMAINAVLEAAPVRPGNFGPFSPTLASMGAELNCGCAECCVLRCPGLVAFHFHLRFRVCGRACDPVCVWC